MKKNLIIGKNSFFYSQLKKLKNFYSIDHKNVSKIHNNFDKIILLSSPPIYKKKKANLNFERKVLKKFKGKRIIFFSTSLVYKKKTNAKENDISKKQNYYSQSKLLIEKEIKKYTTNYVILRVPIVFSSSKYSKNSFFDILTRNIKKNKIIFDYSINSRKDIVPLKQLLNILKIIERKNIIGTYNIGTQKGFTVKQIISLYLKRKIKNNNFFFKQGNEINNLTLNVNKLEKKIGRFKKKLYINAIKELKKI